MPRLCLLLALLPAAAFAQRGKMPRDAASIEAGRQIYMGSCSGCHGATGEGSQGPSLLSGRASRLADQTLFQSIRNGLPGTSMPQFPLADDKVWQIAAFVRSLTAPASSVPYPGDAARGKAFFYGQGKCTGCHMILGEGGHPGPDLSNAGAQFTLHQLREAVTKPSARISDGYRGAAATLKSGRTLEGVAKNYNNYTVQLIDRTGKLHLLRRADLVKFDVRDESIMPAVTDEATATDVVAFLASQTTRPREGDAR